MSRSATATRFAFALLIAVATPAGAQPNQGEDESAALIDEGRAALKRGQLDDAAKALDQAIALNSRRVDAYVLRSAVFAARKQYAEGIALMKRAQSLAPNDAEVLTALGSQLVLSGDVATGVPLLQQVIAKSPGRYDAQLLLGHHWHSIGKWPEAIAALEAYFTARPGALGNEDARHRVDLADAYLRYRQPQKALAVFEQAVRERPSQMPDLRARIGVAWAMAAVDCRKARPMLKQLEPNAEQYPSIWLVDGQCALALGDTKAALTLGRRYLEKVPDGSAAGHALVGEAQAVRGNLVDARRELALARQLEPTRRRWTVRFAHVLRRAGEPKPALAALEQLGPPPSAGIDPDWWHELGETLLATGEAATAVTRLGPIVTELVDAEIWTTYGAAQLASGHAELAIKSLDEALALDKSRPDPGTRTRKLLAEALFVVGSARLAGHDGVKSDPAGAETLLARADQVEGNALIWRNLGIARLALGKHTEAVPVLDRAVKADPSGINLMLAARGRATSGDVPGARPLYERALAADRTPNIEIALDWAASELADGEPTIAVAILEKTSTKGPLAARHRAALADARHAAGLVALRAGNATKAIELLKSAAQLDGAIATKCDLALAYVAADNPTAAVAALRAVTGQACPFPPPADTQAAPILVAFTEGLAPGRAAKALERLTNLGGKSTGVAAALLGTAIRVVALNAAQDAYRSGQLPQTRKYLTTARAANARFGNDELAHNLAVMDLAEGRLDAAIAQLERVAAKVPEALVNLGIAYERKGEPLKALEAWRRARRANVRFPGLAEWIEAKERIHGGATP